MLGYSLSAQNGAMFFDRVFFSAAIITNRSNAYVKLLGNLLIGQSGFLNTVAEKIGQFWIFLSVRFHISNLLAFAVAWPKVATDMIP